MVDWLIVSGAPRSGTTFLNLYLNTHSDIALLMESGLEKTFAELSKFLWNTGQVSAEMSDFRCAIQEQKFFKAFCEARLDKHDVKIVGDKMPNIYSESATKVIENIIGLKPRYIFIVRSPSEVIASSMQRRDNAREGKDVWHINNVNEAAVEWAVNWEYIAAVHDQPNVLVVFYDHFRLDPVGSAQIVADFLGVASEGFSTFPLLLAEKIVPSHILQQVRGVFGELDTRLKKDFEGCLRDLHEIYFSVPFDTQIRFTYEYPETRGYLKSGFDKLETWGIWSTGHRSEVRFRVDPGSSDVLVTLALTVFHFGRDTFDFKLREAGGNEQDFKMGREVPETVSIVCKPDSERLVRLTIMVLQCKQAHEEPRIERRNIGVGLRSMVVQPVSA